MTIVKLTTTDGQPVEYRDEIIGQGGMKDVYFSPDRSYVVAFFRDQLDFQGKERLKSIVGAYRDGIYNQKGGDYWRDLFCWPTGIVEKDGRLGVVAPVYRPHFFFSHGSVNNDMLGIKGKEKEGKWFASASNRAKFLAPEEKGSWLSHLQICLMISRAVRRLHAAGLAHSDLSYKNVLVDPSTGKACIIDIDGLVVPGKFPPDVVGTPDFIAPEVIATQHLSKTDPGRKLPSALTDRHALAVLIYMYLFYRHPLRGSKVHDPDSTKDEELSMGAKALFVEHPTDTSNRVRPDHLGKFQVPWGGSGPDPLYGRGPAACGAVPEGVRGRAALPSGPPDPVRVGERAGPDHGPDPALLGQMRDGLVRVRQHDGAPLPLLRNPLQGGAPGAEPLFEPSRRRLSGRQPPRHGLGRAVPVPVAREPQDLPERAPHPGSASAGRVLPAASGGLVPRERGDAPDA